MGFKTDTSFLRYLSMGAVAVRHVAEEMRAHGFQPIELERYSSSNKIWATKVKRLRLPDLLCVKTGLRVEVKAKSSLAIRMSHTERNAERHWDAGLNDDDLVAFVPCHSSDAETVVTGRTTLIPVGALRASRDASALSRLKSAGEGSEQHLTWPTIVSKRPGRVIGLTPDQMVVEWITDDQPSRRYEYQLSGKTPYLKVGDMFAANTQFLAGTPKMLASLKPWSRRRYHPLSELTSTDPVARYAAAKALTIRSDLASAARQCLPALLGTETDERIALEMANAAVALGIRQGTEFLERRIRSSEGGPLRMEAIFILSELGRADGTAFAVTLLDDIAGGRVHLGKAGNEARQAAVWGLGHSGARAYDRLPRYLADADENVALHAIFAFGQDTPVPVIKLLLDNVLNGPERLAASSAHALRVIGKRSIPALGRAAAAPHGRRSWILYALGGMPAPTVRKALAGTSLLAELEPMLLGSASENWLAREETQLGLNFLSRQTL